MGSGALTNDERAELERLRAQLAAYRHRRRAGVGRWVGAIPLLVLAALLAGLAVVAGYVRAEVLDTESYVETVAPLAEDPAVRQAVADRLADEIVTRTNVTELATELVDRLVEQGAPDRLHELIGPAVSGLRSFLSEEINNLLGTPQFQALWEQVNRAAHNGLVTVLTGGEGEFITASGTTVSLDLGALLAAAKQELVARGIGLAARIPDVSIHYELVNSPELPTVRRYVTLLDDTATWLPFVALALLITGVLVAPNRRRGIVAAAVAVAAVAGLLLAGLAVARTYYLDNLPETVRSPDAAAVVIDTVLRFLVASLQTLLVAAIIVAIVAVLAGPSGPAKLLRTLLGKALDAGARLLARAGPWVATTGRALSGARAAIQTGLVIAAIAVLILAQRPGIASALWTTALVLVLFAVVELFARASVAPSSAPAR
ncbi:MAG TPA: hypothetical protein VIL37_21110 [Natronosporangium sp.]